MVTIMGLAVGLAGFCLFVHAVIVLANYRGEATRYWISLYDLRSDDDPIFRSRRMRVLRSAGAAVELLLGLGLLALGVQFLGATLG